MRFKINDILIWSVFLTGLLSGMSVLQLFNNTLFTYMLYLTLLLLFVNDRKISLQKNMTLLYTAFVVFSAVLCCVNPMFENDWKLKSVIAAINILAGYLFFTKIAVREEYVAAFFKGLHISCLVQLVWCYIQVFVYTVFQADLNGIMFGVNSQVKNGGIVYTGLSTHAGTLVPVLILGFVVSKNYVVKCLFVLMALITGNSTCMIAMMVCVFFYLILFLPDNLKKIYPKITPKKIIVSVILMLILVFILYKAGIFNRFKSVYDRIISVVIYGEFTSGSDATHMRYLTSIPFVLSNTNIINLLFGYGIGTSGFQMTRFFNQYPDKLWTIECDVVDIMYSVGIIGMAVFYFILGCIAIKGFKSDKTNLMFIAAIVIAGIFYNFQMLWLIIIEFIFYTRIKEGKKCWELFSLRKKIDEE